MDRRDEARYISKQRRTVSEWGKDYDAFPDDSDIMLSSSVKRKFKYKKKK